MSRRQEFQRKDAKRQSMRPLLIKDLPETVQMAIKKRAWRDDVSYEKAAADLLYDAEIDRSAQHDVALLDRMHRFDEGWR